MNTERIRELAKQAEEEVKAEYEDESRRNRRLYNEIFLPKFAELIVKECCQKLENDGMVEVAMEMKQHFGVEIGGLDDARVFFCAIEAKLRENDG